MLQRRMIFWWMGLLLSLSCWCPSGLSLAATTAGTLPQDEVWSGLIEITGNVTVPFGSVLRLEPGTVVRFVNNTGLHIYGRLDVVWFG